MSNDLNATPRRVDFETRPKRAFAQASKLVHNHSTRREYDEKGDRKPMTPPTSLLNAISERTASVQSDLESMRQLLPDIELSAQILVSSILSPKDMGVPQLSFTLAHGYSNPELGGKMIRVISDYFVNDYKINDELSTIIRQILFDKGSYIRLIVPESSLDAIINDNGRLTLESIRPHVTLENNTVNNIGLLGPGHPTKNDKGRRVDTEMTLESALKSPGFGNDRISNTVGSSYITVVDNPDAAKMPAVFDKIRRERYTSAMASRFSSLEARKEKALKEKDQKNKLSQSNLYGKTDREVEASMKGSRSHKTEPFLEVPTKDMAGREAYGHPMVVQLDTEAVIPAHTPGDPTNHIGYYVLIDQFGNAISMDTASDHYRDLQTSFQQNASDNQVTSVLKEMRGAYGDSVGGDSITDVGAATQAFADIIERDLLKRLRSGVGHDSIDLSRPSPVYQIMLSRTLQKKRTQILYVPCELMSYFAFYYTKQGIGKSLLEENRIIGSMRAILMFANIMGQIRNSTSLTELDIQLDENDPDPLATVSMVKNSFMRSRATNFPLGEGNAAVIVDYLQQAGVNVVYSGHPGLPDMKVQTSDSSGNKTMIDRDLEEHLRHQHIMGWGLSPETVDMSSQADFATTVVNSNLMLSKRVTRYQAQFESMQADFIQKYIHNSETLLTKLEKIIQDNGDEEDKQRSVEIIESFIAAVEVSLPKPDSVTLEAQMEALRTYRDALEQAIDAWISDEFTLRDADGDYGDMFRELKQAVVAYYLRRWFRENNVLPEIDELTSKDDEGHPLLDFGELHAEHMESIMASLEKYIESAKTASMMRERRSEKGEELREKLLAELDKDPETGEDGSDEATTSDDSSDDTDVSGGEDTGSDLGDESDDLEGGDDSTADAAEDDLGGDDDDDLFGDDGFMDAGDGGNVNSDTAEVSGDETEDVGGDDVNEQTPEETSDDVSENNEDSDADGGEAESTDAESTDDEVTEGDDEVVTADSDSEETEVADTDATDAVTDDIDTDLSDAPDETIGDDIEGGGDEEGDLDIDPEESTDDDLETSDELDEDIETDDEDEGLDLDDSVEEDEDDAISDLDIDEDEPPVDDSLDEDTDLPEDVIEDELEDDESLELDPDELDVEDPEEETDVDDLDESVEEDIGEDADDEDVGDLDDEDLDEETEVDDIEESIEEDVGEDDVDPDELDDEDDDTTTP